MPIATTLIAGGKGVLYSYAGTVTEKDVLDTARKALARPKSAAKVIFSVVEHARDVDLRYEPKSVIYQLEELNKKIIDLLPPGFVEVIIAPSNVAFGYARMWQAMDERAGWESRVVRTREEAVPWLRERVKERFKIELPQDLFTPVEMPEASKR